MTYEELCTRILFEAQRGGEKAELANLNTQSVIESIMPSVLDRVAAMYADDPDKQALLRVTFTIEITNGVGAVPATLLTSRLTRGMVLEPDDATVLPEDIALVPQYVDYVAAKNFEPRLGYWCVNDQVFYYASPSEDTYATFTGDIDYIGPSIPAIPALATDDVDWDDEVSSDVIDLAAEWLRGMKIAA